MIIEISSLPIAIQNAIIQGEPINLTNNGKIIAHVVKNLHDDMTLYEWAMTYDGVDVSDIDIDEIEPIASKNRWVELD